MSDIAALLPHVDDANRPYWTGLKSHRVRLPRCMHCDRFRLSQTRYCPHCGGQESEWQDVSGRGRLWARCVFHQVYFDQFRSRVPYDVVIVELDEGVRVYSNLADGQQAMDVPIGSPLEAVFEAISEDTTLLKFRPA